jgi:hypothetical protein
MQRVLAHSRASWGTIHFAPPARSGDQPRAPLACLWIAQPDLRLTPSLALTDVIGVSESTPRNRARPGASDRSHQLGRGGPIRQGDPVFRACGTFTDGHVSFQPGDFAGTDRTGFGHIVASLAMAKGFTPMSLYWPSTR